jgi:hypothetical protein
MVCTWHARAGGAPESSLCLSLGEDRLISPNVSIVGSNYRYDGLDVPIEPRGDLDRNHHR